MNNKILEKRIETDVRQFILNGGIFNADHDSEYNHLFEEEYFNDEWIENMGIENELNDSEIIIEAISFWIDTYHQLISESLKTIKNRNITGLDKND